MQGVREGTMYELNDQEYLRLDGGNQMRGLLALAAIDPSGDNEAVRKAYIDTVIGRVPTTASVQALIAVLSDPGGTIDARIAAAVAAYLPLAGGVLTGPLTLAGAPTLALHAATMAYADLMLPLAGGVMANFITLHADPANAMHPATKQYVDALPVAPATYDAIVAPAGGDYTSIVTACATEAVGARIFIERGTYNETANIVMKDGQMLIGQNPEDTVIDFGAANRKITPAGAGTNRVVENLTVQGSIANFTIEMNGTYDRVTNCRVIGTVNADSGIFMSGQFSVAENNFITGYTKNAAVYALQFGGSYCTAIGNSIQTCRRGILMATYSLVVGNTILAVTNSQIYVANLGSVVGNTLYGNIDISINGPDCKIVGNQIRGNITWLTEHDHVVITGNEFYLGGIVCTQVNTHSCSISGNVFSAGTGVEFAGYGSTIDGNVFEGAAHLQFSVNSKWNTAQGNQFTGSTEANLTRVTDLGLRGNQAYNNHGVPITSEKKFLDMKNTSGGALGDGDVVVMKAAVANGNEFTTTVNQGDDMVLGMVNEAINNNAEGMIQTLGKVVTLKVNGVINIGIGDLLGTFTAAGISMQAQAGDMAFAIALEAYAVADSNGVIDALLITPRKI